MLLLIAKPVYRLKQPFILLTSRKLHSFVISFIKMVTNKGPKIKPWGALAIFVYLATDEYIDFDYVQTIAEVKLE